MKQILCIVATTFLTTICSAQNGIITIQQDEKISVLMDIYKYTDENASFYTIQVGSSNYLEAEKLKMEVDIDFPEWHSKIKFEYPSYRVRIGRFKTKLEAEQKFNELRKKYPRSMLLKPEKTIE